MGITYPIINNMEKRSARTDLDGTVTEFLTYDEYLDYKITSLDLFYLEDEKLARQVVELGLRGTGEVWKREEFESRKAAAQASRLSKRSEQKTLASAGKELKDNFLRALAEREEANRSGKNHTIIFIRDHGACGQEISGYIDYAHRLKREDFEPYFSGKKKLLPRPNDLSDVKFNAKNLSTKYCSLCVVPSPLWSFYNWKTNEVAGCDSENYQVIANNSTGVLFKNKKDRNIVNVDPEESSSEHSPRMPFKSDIYLHVAIFDHYIKCTV